MKALYKLLAVGIILSLPVSCVRDNDTCWKCQFKPGAETKTICGTKEQAMQQVMNIHIPATGDSTTDSNNFLKACKQ